MTARQSYTLTCDAEACGATFGAGFARADQTRAAASTRLGWRHVVRRRPQGPHRSLDYCPAHVTLGEGLSPKTLPEHSTPLADAASLSAPYPGGNEPDGQTQALEASALAADQRLRDLVERSSVGEGLQRLRRDGADAEARRVSAELTPEVMASVAKASAVICTCGSGQLVSGDGSCNDCRPVDWSGL